MKKNIIESECNKPQSSDTTIVLQQDKVIRSVSSGGFDLNENSKKYKCYEIKNKVIEPYLNKINRYYIDSNGCLKRNKKVTIKKLLFYLIQSSLTFSNYF